MKFYMVFLVFVILFRANLHSQLAQEEWVARYNGPANGSDRATSLAIDSGGNAYVAGTSHGGGALGDYATIKWDGDGFTFTVIDE